MFATSKLPEDIIGIILRGADLPIDTRLVMKDYLEPRKICIPEGLARKLDALHARRTKNYKRYVKLRKDGHFLWSITVDYSDAIQITERKFIEFHISDTEKDINENTPHERAIEFHEKITEMELATGSWPYMSIQNTRCDMHTGLPFPITFGSATLQHLQDRPQ